MLLRLEKVQRHFGGVRAVDEVSLEVEKGSIQGLIGPNGAGKTTLLNVASGMLSADAGTVVVGGVDVSHFPPELRATYGLGRSFQQASLFPGLTVTETMQVAMSTQHRAGVLASAASAPWVRAWFQATAAGTGTGGYSGDGGLSVSANIFYPYGVGVDKTGYLYIADTNNNRIRKVTLGRVHRRPLTAADSAPWRPLVCPAWQRSR